MILVSVCWVTWACSSFHQAAYVDLPSLVGKDPNFVEAQLGKPTTVSTTAGDPEETCVYSPSRSTKTVTVFFRNKRAYYFEVVLPTPAKDAKEALRLVGIDVSNSQPYVDIATATRYRDQISGVIWKDVSATSSSSAPVKTMGYDLVLATAAEAN